MANQGALAGLIVLSLLLAGVGSEASLAQQSSPQGRYGEALKHWEPTLPRLYAGGGDRRRGAMEYVVDSLPQGRARGPTRQARYAGQYQVPGEGNLEKKRQEL